MINDEELKDKRIAVLLSGGVDSAVVVWELARLGLKPDCFYIKIGPEETEEWDCSSEEDMEMATAVAARFGCRLEVVDCHKEYWDEVTRYTMEKVRSGLTPNPDVMCNRLIKFGAFHEKRGHDYDLIATGHYAQTEIDEEGRKWLVTSPDPVKANLRLATEEGLVPHRPHAEGRGEGDCRARALGECAKERLARHLLLGKNQLQRLSAPLSRRTRRRHH